MSALVHGLAGREAEPDWPPLTGAELEPVLAHYPAAGPIRRLAWRSPRPFAASGLAECAHQTVFVKRHAAAIRTPGDLAEEHTLLAHLRTGGVPVPAVLRTRTGETTVATAAGVYEIHAQAPGQDLYRDAVSWSPFADPAHAGAAGAALATLHRAAASHHAPHRATTLLVADFRVFGAADPIAALEERLRGDALLSAALANYRWEADFAETLLPWHARLLPHMRSLAPLWTHNDFHASNLLWSGTGANARVAAILDFGLANVTSVAFDLATAIERNCIEWLRLANGETDIAHADLAARLIGGYCAAHALPPGQAAALPHILPLVHAEFALSELVYFHGILHSAEKSDLAYYDFLLEHARWFTTGCGQEFLRVLREVVDSM
jgi:Ser/Thr protein kinase RdoA (MazF antagonist)